MDIIVTTPKARMAEAAQEAADCIAAGGGEYFRRFAARRPPSVIAGKRFYYVEDGYIRGFAVVSRVENMPYATQCDTTGRCYRPGVYVFMRADSWQWIQPLPMLGFEGFRYVEYYIDRQFIRGAGRVRVVGGWRDKRPATPGLTRGRSVV